MRFIICEVPTRTVEDTFPDETISIKIRFCSAGRDASIGGVVGVEAKGSTTGLASTIASPTIRICSTGSHTIAVGVVCELIRICRAWPNTSLSMSVPVFGQSSVTNGHTYESMFVGP